MLNIKVFEFNPVSENTYILSNENKDCCIIDAGCYHTYENSTLKAYVEAEKLLPKYLLNTHCHLDHIFGNNFIHTTWGLQLHIPVNEKIVFEMAPAAAIKWNLPFKNYDGPLHFIHEHDEIKMGDDVLKVIAAPGHSPGHICFYCAAQNFIIGGDVLFRKSIGRTDLPGGNHQQLLKNICEKLFVLPDETVVYPGHGEPTTIGYEKNHNPFLQ
jgi:hydroxyacylglutathione hydrolase